MSWKSNSKDLTPPVFCEGERVFLRRVERSDAPLIAQWKRDPVVQRMALGPGTEVSAAEERRGVAGAIRSDAELYLLIGLRASQEPIGYVRIAWMDGDHRFAWLRFALGRRRGQGHASEALRCVLARLFGEGLHRVEAEVYAFNEPSLRVLERLGFRREGLKRQAHFTGEGYCDVVVLGLLREDFEGATGP